MSDKKLKRLVRDRRDIWSKIVAEAKDNICCGEGLYDEDAEVIRLIMEKVPKVIRMAKIEAEMVSHGYKGSILLFKK